MLTRKDQRRGDKKRLQERRAYWRLRKATKRVLNQGARQLLNPGVRRRLLQRCGASQEIFNRVLDDLWFDIQPARLW